MELSNGEMTTHNSQNIYRQAVFVHFDQHTTEQQTEKSAIRVKRVIEFGVKSPAVFRCSFHILLSPDRGGIALQVRASSYLYPRHTRISRHGARIFRSPRVYFMNSLTQLTLDFTKLFPP